MVDASDRKVIGQRSADFDSTMGAVWIRGFKEGETQIRVLETTNDWWRYKEHYGGSREIGYFPCLQDDACVGCTDLSERVRKTSTKYAFNGIDKDGRVRVFKMGAQLKKKLAMREQRMGADILQRRDLVVIRSGSGFSDTEYDFEWGDEYEIDPPNETEINDLAQVITDAYYAVAEAYERGDVGGEDAEDVPADHADDEVAPPAAEKPAAKKAAPAKRAAAAKAAPAEPAPAAEEPKRNRIAKKAAAPDPEPEPESAEQDAEPEESTEDVPDNFEEISERLRGMETDEIRELLKQSSIEFPPRAARPRLIALAEAGVLDGKVPPF